MEYELTDIGPCRKRLILNFSADEVSKVLGESYAEVDNHVQIKGFRRGKAPRRILEKKYGREAILGAEDILAERNVNQTVEKEKIVLLGNADKITEKGILKDGEPYKLEYEFDIRPDFEMPEYKNLNLHKVALPVTDEALDERMENIRHMFAKYDPVEEPAQKEDILNVDFKAEVEGNEIMNMADRNLRVEGDRLFGLPFPELEEKFVGVKAGDKVELTIDLPADHPEEELQGKPAKVEIVVKRVERPILPELTDDFAASIGMSSIADFRNRIRLNMDQEAAMEARREQEKEVLDQLIAKVDFPVPEKYVKEKASFIVRDRVNELARQGQGVPDMEALKKEADIEADRQTRWEIFASRIADAENIQVSNQEVSRHVERLAQSFNTTPAKIVQRIRDFNGGPAMVKEIMDIKVMQLIIDSAKQPGGIIAKTADETESANADAAQTATNSGCDCGCGHDHGHDHTHDHDDHSH